MDQITTPEAPAVETGKTYTVNVTARSRDINARCSNGGDTYTMLVLPGSHEAVWADQIPGAEIVSDDYPRARGIRASERRGSTVVKLDLPIGSIRIRIFKPISQRERTSREAAVLDPHENRGEKALLARPRLRQPAPGRWLLAHHRARW